MKKNYDSKILLKDTSVAFGQIMISFSLKK